MLLRRRCDDHVHVQAAEAGMERPFRLLRQLRADGSAAAPQPTAVAATPAALAPPAAASANTSTAAVSAMD